MKPVKHLLTSSSKLVNVPELTFKKGLFNSPLSPKPKEKHSAKVVRDKLEPMVLKSPPTGESIVRYALPIPSSKTKELIAEDELIRKITKHLKMVVSSLEETYGYGTQNGEKAVVKPEHEELNFSVGDDLTSFLICCSQFATQLEAAAKEEHNILESLFKWFQRQVNQMEEISKDQTFSEAEFPTPDKTVSLSIAQIVKQVHKLEELKNRLKEGSKGNFRELLSKPKDSGIPPEDVQTYETVKQKIEEFIKTHSTEEITDVSVTEPQTSPVTNQLNTMLKIFENQANKLERAMNEQLMLEAKYTQIQSDLQVLSEEKLMLENELQKLKSTEKTKATSERTKKVMKTEKKKDKGKSEDSEAKKSVGKELKVKENMPQVQKVAHALEIENKVLREQLKQALQEAERAKQQLAYFLNQEKEFLKSEAKTKTTTEMGTGKLKVKGEDSKYILLENETRKAVVGDSGGQKTNDKITYPQILKSQDGSSFLKTPSERLTDEDLSRIVSSKNYDKTFTTMLQHEEIKDAQSAGKLLQENEMFASSFISPSVVQRRVLGTDISKVADILEEKFKTKLEKQTYQEARGFQAPGRKLDENPLLKNETPSEAKKRLLKPGTARANRRNAFLITEPKAITIDDQLPEDIDSVLNRRSQVNLEASGSGSFDSYDEASYEKVMLNHQDLVSKTQMQVKKQRTLKKERLSTHDKVRDKKRMHENLDSKIQQHVKKGKSHRREGHTTCDDVSDESLMFMQQDLKLETEIHVEKQKSSGPESVTSDKVPDENPVLEQESMSETQLEVKKQRPSKERRLSSHEKISDANLMHDHQESMSKSQMTVKQQKEEKHTQDEVPDGNHMLDHQELMSESEIQVKKESFHTGERFTTYDDAPDKTPVLQHQESVPKLPIQEQKTSKGGEHITQDEVLDGNPMLEHQDSRSKSEIHVKKPSFHKGETLTTSDNDVPDHTPVLQHQDSVSKLPVQVQKQITPRGGKHSTQDEVPDRNRILHHQDSVSKSEIQVKKPSLHKGEGLTAPDDVPDNTPVLQHQDSVSKLPMQVQKQISSGEGKHGTPDKVPGGNLILEHEDSELKKQAQVKKQRTSIGERLKTRIGVPDENLTVFDQYPVSKLQTQVEKQINYRRERSQSYFGASGQNPLLVNEDLVSKPQKQVKKEIASREERRYTYPFQNQKNDMITVENLHPEKKDLFSRKQSQTQKPRAIKKENLDAQKARDISSEDEIGSKSQSQTEKLRAGKMETLNNQDVDELSDEKFALDDLVRTKGYKDNTQLSGVYHPQILRIKRETTTEHPDIAENLPEMNPSIDDLIFQLDLNKVIEIDLEHLKDTLGRHIRIVENKTLAKAPLETHTERYAEATRRNILKGEIKSHLASDAELFPDIIGKHFLKSEFKTQPKNHLGTNIQGLTGKTGRGVIKGQFRTQSSNLPDTDTEHFPNAVGRSMLKSDIKTQSKSHPGKRVNLFKDKDKSTQHQTEFFTGHIAGSKFPMNVINFSQVDNQDLLKGKNAILQQENVYARHVAPSKYKTKIITLSPFDDEDVSFEDFSSYMTERPKVLHRPSKTRPGFYKAINFPSLNKEHSGHQKRSTLKKKNIEHEETLPTVIATTRKPVYKGKSNVPYTTA
ncbi:coiled-coil domain-containing protein 7 isoform X7 [Bos taurus]|uniref:coiled-coil domain-containing protein 7 isoform X7 n=1 Tax=Bos taurus TaxID=9913 RepID=UPI000D531FCF|nr:coiled-coil domain-containing protein 7 isoform X7 [Bos taurus]